VRKSSPSPQPRDADPHKALYAVIGRADTSGTTVAEAETALAELQSQPDERWAEISLAKKEAERLRTGELAAAIRQRDEAVAQVITSEGLIAGLLNRYFHTRKTLAELYCALTALPVGMRPQGLWQELITLPELQAGDQWLADQIRETIAALAQDPDAPLPSPPAPLSPLTREARRDLGPSSWDSIPAPGNAALSLSRSAARPAGRCRKQQPADPRQIFSSCGGLTSAAAAGRGSAPPLDPRDLRDWPSPAGSARGSGRACRLLEMPRDIEGSDSNEIWAAQVRRAAQFTQSH
jgi:hypothetical protein